MHRVMYTNASQYVSNRDGVFYYIRRIPYDVRQHYASSRISYSLRTKSVRTAARAASSVRQRLEDYWLGLGPQQMDIPAIHLVRADDLEDNSPLPLDAVEMYLHTKGKTDKTFIRTARRNAAYVVKVLGNKPITSYATSEDVQVEKHLRLDRVEAAILDKDNKSLYLMWGKIKRECPKGDTFAWPIKLASERCGCSKSDVGPIMQKLEKLGAVTIIQKGKAGKYYGKANIYRREI